MILHILLKDLRRHWREIALFVLVCAAFTWQTTHPFGWLWRQQKTLVPILLFILWFFIVVRVVQGENPVGDREFWPTRPYRWGKLMAAKALLLILCLNGPLLASEIVLLVHAGIPLSLSLVPGLLFLQLEFAFFLTFPAAALAALTETLVQWVLAIAGILLCAMMISWLPWNKLEAPLEGGENVASLLGGGLLVLALAFVLLWQYARRRVWPARLALGGALLTIPLFILIAPSPLVRSIAYPRPTGAAPLHLSMLKMGTNGERQYTRRDSYSDTSIEIPVVADSFDSDTLINAEGWRVTLNGDNGWRWQSPWINQPLSFSYDDAGVILHLEIPTKLANQIAQAHATASVELAFAVHRLGPAQRIETGADRFAIPGVGFCHWFGGEYSRISLRGFECSAPLRLPGVVVTRADSASVTCPQEEGEPPLPPGHYASGTYYGNDAVPAEFDPDPVRSFQLNMGAWTPMIPIARDPKQARNAYVCRGTPLTVRTGHLVGKFRETFDLGDLGTEKLITAAPEGSILFDPANE